MCALYTESSSYFSTTANLLILGVLQGSGAAPCIWMCVSNVLFQALSSRSVGLFSPHCPRCILTTSCPGEAFVQICTGIHDGWNFGFSYHTYTGLQYQFFIFFIYIHWYVIYVWHDTHYYQYVLLICTAVVWGQ